MTKPTALALGIGAAGLVCAAAAAALSPPWRWLLAWTALSCEIVALAYARNWPGVYGKRRGRLSPLRTALLLPFLMAFWTSCALMRWWRRHPALEPVAPGVYVGGRLRRRHLPRDVALVVDLTSEFGEARDVRDLPQYRCVPVLDGGFPADEEAFLAVLDEAAAATGSVVFHCDSGVGRAPTAAMLLLMRRGITADPSAALELVRKGRPPAKPTRSDLGFVERLAGRWRRNGT